MRIKYIIPSKPSPSYINIEMWQMLVHELTVCDQVDIVDMSPDIVHIFGIWNLRNVRLVEQYRSKDIPVVFTSINGMLGIVPIQHRARNAEKLVLVPSADHAGLTILALLDGQHHGFFGDGAERRHIILSQTGV